MEDKGRGRPKQKIRKATKITVSKFYRYFTSLPRSDLLRLGSRFIQGHISFVQLSSEFARLKSLQKVRKAFVKVLGLKSWPDALAAFPFHTHDATLSQWTDTFQSFKQFKNGECDEDDSRSHRAQQLNVPEQFLDWCLEASQVVKSRASIDLTKGCEITLGEVSAIVYHTEDSTFYDSFSTKITPSTYAVWFCLLQSMVTYFIVKKTCLKLLIYT